MKISMQVKYIDDATQAAFIHLKLSLIPDPVERPSNSNERLAVIKYTFHGATSTV